MTLGVTGSLIPVGTDARGLRPVAFGPIGVAIAPTFRAARAAQKRDSFHNWARSAG